MSTRNLPGGKARPARKAHNLVAISEENAQKRWAPDVSQPYKPSQSVTEIALLLLTFSSRLKYYINLSHQSKVY